MPLSQRAIKYLNTLARNSEFFSDRESTIKYFNAQQFPVNEKLVEIQVNFSGYNLTIRDDIGQGFLLKLFSKSDMENNVQIEVYRFYDMYIIDIGDHKTAQFNFYITNEGELCTLVHQGDNKPNIICSSIEKFIERYALQDELALQAKNRHYHNLLNNEKLSKLLGQDFSGIDECSDKYGEWFTNGQLTIEKGTWLDAPKSYLKVYGQRERYCDKFINNLKHNKIIP